MCLVKQRGWGSQTGQIDAFQTVKEKLGDKRKGQSEVSATVFLGYFVASVVASIKNNLTINYDCVHFPHRKSHKTGRI